MVSKHFRADYYTFCTTDYSYHGLFVPYTFRTMDHLVHLV